MLDQAFEEAGYCVLRGPDVIWGGDIRRFHPPRDFFEGVIGGPPCQAFSRLVHMVRANGYEPRFGNLIPEFERCIAEAGPDWFLMENVPAAPIPSVPGYLTHAQLLNNAELGEEQNRVRRISFGTAGGQELPIARGPGASFGRTLVVLNDTRTGTVRVGGNGKVKVTAGDTGGHGMGRNPKTMRRTLAEMAELQGFPSDFLRDSPFTDEGKRKAIANGVPLPMGRCEPSCLFSRG